MKRGFAYLLALILSLTLLAGCKGADSSPSSGTSSQPVVLGYTLALVLPIVPTESWTQVQRGFEAAASQTGITPLVYMPAIPQDAQQIAQQVRRAIEEGADGVLLCGLDQEAMNLAAPLLDSARIPYLLLDGQAEKGGAVALVSSDAQLGPQLAQLVQDSHTKEIHYVAAIPSLASPILAVKQQFSDTLTTLAQPASPKEETLVETQEDRTLGSQLLQEALRQSNANTLVCFTTVDTLAAADAKEQSALEVQVFGRGWNSEIASALQAGFLDGAAVPHYFRLGYQSVMTLADHLQGQEIPEAIQIDMVLVSRENLEGLESLLQNPAQW